MKVKKTYGNWTGTPFGGWNYIVSALVGLCERHGYPMGRCRSCLYYGVIINIVVNNEMPWRLTKVSTSIPRLGLLWCSAPLPILIKALERIDEHLPRRGAELLPESRWNIPTLCRLSWGKVGMVIAFGGRPKIELGLHGRLMGLCTWLACVVKSREN
jgi:hypothetical protein